MKKESALRAVLKQQAGVFLDTLKRVKDSGLVVSTLEPKAETREVATQTDVRLAPGPQPARLPKALTCYRCGLRPCLRPSA